jgi:hypothetical protein
MRSDLGEAESQRAEITDRMLIAGMHCTCVWSRAFGVASLRPASPAPGTGLATARRRCPWPSASWRQESAAPGPAHEYVQADCCHHDLCWLCGGFTRARVHVLCPRGLGSG